MAGVAMSPWQAWRRAHFAKVLEGAHSHAEECDLSKSWLGPSVKAKN
jgi:hypothetical protein